MQSEIFALCDFAKEMNGGITIVNTIDSISSQNVPFVYLPLSIAVRVRFDFIEINKEHLAKINFFDPEGKEILITEFKIFPTMQPGNHSAFGNITFSISSIGKLEFSHFGRYSVILTIGETRLMDIPLFINHAN